MRIKPSTSACLSRGLWKRSKTGSTCLWVSWPGVLILFALLNFYLFISVKEPIHIWYGLYILFTLCFVIKHEGLDMQFLGLDSTTGYRATSMAAFAGIGSGFLVHVVQLFLTNIPRRSFLGWALFIDKWFLWLSGAAYASYFLSSLPIQLR